MSKASVFGFIVVAVVLLMSAFPMLNALDRGFSLTYDVEEQNYGNFSVDDFANPPDGNVTTDTCNSGDLLYPSQSSSCNWLIEYNMSSYSAGLPSDLSYSADMTDGEGNVTVRVYANNTLQDSETELLTGSNINVSYEQDFSDLEFSGTDVDRVEVEFDLNETAGDNDKRPAVDSYELEFIESYGEESLGLSNTILGTFIMMLFLFVVVVALLYG